MFNIGIFFNLILQFDEAHQNLENYIIINMFFSAFLASIAKKLVKYLEWKKSMFYLLQIINEYENIFFNAVKNMHF